MFTRITPILFFFCLGQIYAAPLSAQEVTGILTSTNKQNIAQPLSLFQDDDILQLKLTAKLGALFNDRNNQVAYHPMLLQYKAKDSSIISIQLKARTRGNFRRKRENCSMPPLLLNFQKPGKVKNNIFDNQNKLKLVVPCKGDEYVIREWLVYKLYNLITEKSFRSRLVQVTFEDSLKKKKTETHYCILLEDENSVAKRNDGIILERTGFAMQSTDRDILLKMAVFQFMIGNTDWSVPYLQNIKLISKDSTKMPFAVPYDFDHAGIVSAPYALPASQLELASVLERRYRGYCISGMDLAGVFAFFNATKNDFYRVYIDCELLNDKYQRFVTKYLNDFYNIINNDKSVEKEFRRPCYERTRVEIKGLKER